MKKIAWLIPLILFIGCQKPDEVNNAKNKAIISTEITLVIMAEPSPQPAPDKVPRSKCEKCHGTGRVKTGDGLSWTNCDACYDDDKGVSPSPQPSDSLPAVDITPPKTDDCTCKECKCANCQCKIELNNTPIIAKPITYLTREQVFNKYKLSWHTTNKRCCQDCVCVGKCMCLYRGECLVNRNNGNDVIIKVMNCSRVGCWFTERVYTAAGREVAKEGFEKDGVYIEDLR